MLRKTTQQMGRLQHPTAEFRQVIWGMVPESWSNCVVLHGSGKEFQQVRMFFAEHTRHLGSHADHPGRDVSEPGFLPEHFKGKFRDLPVTEYFRATRFDFVFTPVHCIDTHG